MTQKKPWWVYFAIINPVTFSLGLFLAMAMLSASHRAPIKISPTIITASIIPEPSPTPAFPIPKNIYNTNAPWINARGAYILDLTSNTVIYEKNAEAELPAASTTKITTALVAADIFDLRGTITITNGNESIGSKADIKPGEIYSVSDLLYALLLDSGNDAAVTLAQHHPDGYTGFINAMNQKVKTLGLPATHFTNASGIDSPYHYSSAKDLAILGKNLINNPVLANIVDTRSKTITDQRWHRQIYLTNTNLLLGIVEGVHGIKTGSTPLAGECLITYINENSHPVIISILGSPDRFSETKSLIDWVYQYHQWL
jgi:serine-type D-Ala-D-Ala carboxypeptidase (penicillin-binding protein 5/6)